ncbi:MAG: signal peptidase II, partial [Candidatus Cloacimonetes bacterium]|nr:signal peptidase II [Candidatus Cloacimonadota bacterium]
MQKYNFSYLYISLYTIVFDQLSKIAVRTYMPDREIPVIGEFFKLTHVQNSGAAFSLSIGSEVTNRIVFSIVTFFMIFVILYLLSQSKHFLEKISYSLIIGGAIGNLADRALLGSVTDFLDFDFFTINIKRFDFYMDRWPIFNIADSSIVVAISLLLF